ncbi:MULTISPECIES: TadE family protein [Arthrobacter]|uniref:TadE family protein n=1 Tax=Arthrobacter nanjingensis TaxID=1387716 RepID=A0ABU9KLM7_9MICC
MVDFVLVAGLMTALFLGILQLTVILHVRNTLVDAASSGARYGALADRTAADAKGRTEDLIGSAVGNTFSQDVTADEQQVDGRRIVTVTVRSPFPALGLLGPSLALEVSGHAARHA